MQVRALTIDATATLPEPEAALLAAHLASWKRRSRCPSASARRSPSISCILPLVPKVHDLIYGPGILNAQLARHASIQDCARTTVNSQNDPSYGLSRLRKTGISQPADSSTLVTDDSFAGLAHLGCRIRRERTMGGLEQLGLQFRTLLLLTLSNPGFQRNLLVPVSHHDQLAATRLSNELSKLVLSFLHCNRFHAETLPRWVGPGKGVHPPT